MSPLEPVPRGNPPREVSVRGASSQDGLGPPRDKHGDMLHEPHTQLAVFGPKGNFVDLDGFLDDPVPPVSSSTVRAQTLGHIGRKVPGGPKGVLIRRASNPKQIGGVGVAVLMLIAGAVAVEDAGRWGGVPAGLTRCVRAAREVLRLLYPGGVKGRWAVDDGVVIPAGMTPRGVRVFRGLLTGSGDGWAVVASLGVLFDELRADGPGGTVVLLVSFAGEGKGHALVAHAAEDGGVWLVDALHADGPQVYQVPRGSVAELAVPDGLGRAVAVQAVKIGADGRVTEPGRWAGGAPRGLHADAPLSHEFEARKKHRPTPESKAVREALGGIEEPGFDPVALTAELERHPVVLRSLAAHLLKFGPGGLPKRHWDSLALVLARRTSLVRALADTPKVLGYLLTDTDNSAMKEFAANPGWLEPLEDPGFALALETDAPSREKWLLWSNHLQLVSEWFGGRTDLLQAADSNSEIAQLLTVSSELASALMARPDALLVLADLRTRPGLVDALCHGLVDAHGLTREQYDRLFDDIDFMNVLSRNVVAIDPVVRVPGMLDAAMRNPESVPVLNKNPLLADVLLDSPDLARRLAASAHLTEIAGEVAEVLSFNPWALDGALGTSSDDQLEGLLRALESPAPLADLRVVSEPPTGRNEASIQKALRVNPLLKAALDAVAKTDKARAAGLTGKIAKAKPVVDALAEHPNLLRYPHEYLRLLHQADVHGEPLDPLIYIGRLNQDTLRVILRAPMMRDQSDMVRWSKREYPGYFEAMVESGALRYYSQTLDLPRLNEAAFAKEFLQMVLRSERYLQGWSKTEDWYRRDSRDKPEHWDEICEDDWLFILATRSRGLARLLATAPAALEAARTLPVEVKRSMAMHADPLMTEKHWDQVLGSDLLKDLAAADEGRAALGVLVSTPGMFLEASARWRALAAYGADSLKLEVPQIVAQAPNEQVRRDRLLEYVHAAGGDSDFSAEGIPLREDPLRGHMGFVTSGRAGYPHAQELERLFRDIYPDMPAEERERLVAELRLLPQVVEGSERLAVLVGRSEGLALALLRSPHLARILADRPALLSVLEGPSSAQAIVGMYLSPGLFRQMTEQPHQYSAYTDDQQVVARLAYHSDVFRENLRNPFRGALGTNTFYTLGQEFPEHVERIMDSPAWCRALAEHGVSVQEMLLRPGFLDAVADWPEAEVAVIAGRAELLDVLSANPGLTRGAKRVPGLLEALRDSPARLTGVEFRVLVRGLSPKTGQAASLAGLRALLESDELVKLAMAVPRVLALAAAGEEGLMRALAGNAHARRLVREHPRVVETFAGRADLQDLLSRPDVVTWLAGDAGRAGLLSASPGLVTAIREKRFVVVALNREQDPWLERVLVTNPGLAPVLTRRMVVGLRRNRRLAGLLGEQAAVEAVEPAVLWRAVLAHSRLVAVLNQHRWLAELMLADETVQSLLAGHPDWLVQWAGRASAGQQQLSGGELVAQLQAMAVTHGAQPGPAVGISLASPASPAGEVPVLPAGVPELPVSGGEAGTRVGGMVTEAVELAELLAGGQAAERALVDAVAANPELLMLLVALPDVVEVAAEGADMRRYSFAAFLEEHGLTEFERDFAGWVQRHQFGLNGEGYKQVKAIAAMSWEGVGAGLASRRTERWARLNPLARETWQHLPGILYHNGLGPGDFTEQQAGKLKVLARDGRGMQETTVVLHAPLHAHLDGGKGGVSFTYVVDADGFVRLLVYAISRIRLDNDYRWTGGRRTGGALALEYGAVDSHAAWRQSEKLLDGKGDLASAPGPDGGPVLGKDDQGLVSQVKDLTAALLHYHEARDGLTAAPPETPKKKGKKKGTGAVAPGGDAQRLQEARQVLVRLGFDPDAALAAVKLDQSAPAVQVAGGGGEPGRS
jgi:hypothetical protein